MNKEEFINRIAKQENMTKVDVAKCVDLVLDNIKAVLKEGISLRLANFAKFEIIDVAEKKGIIGLTGECYTSPAHKKIKVSLTKELKDYFKKK